MFIVHFKLNSEIENFYNVHVQCIRITHSTLYIDLYNIMLKLVWKYSFMQTVWSIQIININFYWKIHCEILIFIFILPTFQ